MSIKSQWRGWLTPGVATLIGATTLCYLAGLIGNATGSFNLYRWLALAPPRFWSGEVWTVATYFLLPGGWADLLLNGFFIAWLGGMIERGMRRGDFLLYCLITVLGTGLAKVLLTPASPFMLVGTGGVVFGLIAAIWHLLGHERVMFLGIGEMSIRTAMWIIGGLNIVIALPCAGWVNTLIMLSGAVAGWIYLVLRSRIPGGGTARQVPDERVRKLEL
jgi:membrane associated rhomboid family serine protease